MKKIIEQKYFILLILFCVGVVTKMHAYNTSVNTIYGVADTKETVVTSKYPVLIKRIHVYPGQKVARGDILLETENQDLALQIFKLQSELSALNAKNRFNRAMNEHLDSVDIKTNKKFSYTNPLQFQIASLNNQIKILEKEKADLNIYAETDSVVGVVNVRQGERQAAFEPFLTLIKNTPLFVRGYIHEYVNCKTFRHQKVAIRSFSNPTETIAASVVEIGDRIVQFPPQILRGESSPLWGREVIIALPRDNSFLVGEKLLIQLEKGTYVIDGDTFDRTRLLSENEKESQEIKL